jgi:hypothetical protein
MAAGDRPAEPLTRRGVDGSAAELVARLQRTAGNHATTRMIARLLTAAQASKRALDAWYEQNSLSHIKLRHGPGSTAKGAGKFNDWKKVEGWLKLAVEKGTAVANGSEGFKFTRDCGESTGVDINGKATTGITVVVNFDGPKKAYIATAYPT